MQTRRPTYRVYQEPGQSVFVHDDRRYDLNSLLKRVDGRKIFPFRVSDLSWILQHDRPVYSRVKKANIKAPILVTRWNGKLVVIDGLHRLSKALEMQVDTLPGRLVTPGDLKAVSLD